MTEPMPEPTDHPPAIGSTGNLTLTLGLHLCQVNGVDVPPSVLADVQEAMRQQVLRQLLAEREVADLRAEVERLRAALPDSIDPASVRPMLQLLGPARMVLDRAAVLLGERDRGAEAADMAQRIVEWIGHPVTDEPATAADLQAEVYRLQHLLYGDAGPDASDPDDSDPIPAACHVEHQGAFCRARAHIHCAGIGICAVDGAAVPCSCACHGAAVGATA